MKARKRAPGQARPWHQWGSSRLPRVKLATGLARTREKSTSLLTTRLKYLTPGKPQKFHQGRVGRQAGVELAMTLIILRVA